MQELPDMFIDINGYFISFMFVLFVYFAKTIGMDDSDMQSEATLNGGKSALKTPEVTKSNKLEIFPKFAPSRDLSVSYARENDGYPAT